jgi:hypothetical protein
MTSEDVQMADEAEERSLRRLTVLIELLQQLAADVRFAVIRQLSGT